ncbi:nodal homolog [Bombina bombina]|uniref:nodal homolog n=1 Tax=Bombina bombina TaxID=8345 RepID=UPI00235A8DCE|nr:nodal homolog [Bombina bombina]
MGHRPNISQEHFRGLGGLETRGLSSLPNYMISLYQSFSRMDFASDYDSEPVKQPVPPGPRADIIRSLAAKSFQKVDERWVVVFDFGILNTEEDILMAELRFEAATFAGHLHDGLEVNIDIFHQSFCKGSDRLCQTYLHLGSFTGRAQSRPSDDWVKLNITEVVQKWSKRTVIKHQTNSKQVHRLQKTQKATNIKPNDQKVLMFVYSNLSRKEKETVTATLLHDAALSKYLVPLQVNLKPKSPKRHRRSHIIRDHMSGMRHAQAVHNASTLCRRVDFYVDFSLIGWDQWIIHPLKYNAYRCEGLCPSPVNEGLRPHNHAYLQSIVNFYMSSKAPPVCCAPLKMSALSMAYRKDREIVVEHHEEMIVEECGCQ